MRVDWDVPPVQSKACSFATEGCGECYLGVDPGGVGCHTNVAIPRPSKGACDVGPVSVDVDSVGGQWGRGVRCPHGVVVVHFGGVGLKPSVVPPQGLRGRQWVNERGQGEENGTKHA
jgi:hypothetical protein